MKYLFLDINNQDVFNNLSAKCLECYNGCNTNSQLKYCTENGSNSRMGRMNKNGITFLCSLDQVDISSSRKFKDKLKLFKEISKELPELKNEITIAASSFTKRLLHNVITYNAHNIQEVYALVPQEQLSKKINEQISVVSQRIDSNVDEAARVFLRIAKNNLALKTEFSVFRKIYDTNPSLDKRNHPIEKVVLNTFHVFSQDFKEKYITFNIETTEQKISIDYESFQVVLYHIMDNALKYCKPHSSLNIRFRNEKKHFFIIFEMMSIQIDPDEVEKIFEDGYFGRNTKTLKKTGTGLGLGLIKEILKVNNAKLNILINTTGKTEYYNNINYQNNIFEMDIIKN